MKGFTFRRPTLRQVLVIGAPILLLHLLAGLYFGLRSSVAAPAAPAIEPLPARTELVEQVAADKPDELLDKLIDKFDDVAWAATGVFGGGNVDDFQSYGYPCKVIPAMGRVRRVIEEYRDKPGAVTPKLTKMLTSACDGYEQSWDEMDRQVRIEAEAGRVATYSTPPDFGRRAIKADAATYLLGEFRCYKALPVMARVFEQKSRPAVPRAYLFYAMHTLALSHPRDGLSPEAVAALNAYLEATKKDVPPPKEISVPAWNAKLDETDFRATIGRKNIGLDKEPQVVLHEYPYEFRKYDSFNTRDPNNPNVPVWGVVPEVQPWFTKLKAFIRLAYPDSK